MNCSLRIINADTSRPSRFKTKTKPSCSLANTLSSNFNFHKNSTNLSELLMPCEIIVNNLQCDWVLQKVPEKHLCYSSEEGAFRENMRQLLVNKGENKSLLAVERSIKEKMGRGEGTPEGRWGTGKKWKLALALMVKGYKDKSSITFIILLAPNPH